MKWFQKIWLFTDAALLAGLFTLLGWAFWKGSIPVAVSSSEKEYHPVSESVDAPVEKQQPVVPQEKKRPMVIRGIRVNNRMLPMDRVAEHMTSEALQERIFHALDMRERNRAYEISLSLPEGVREDMVQVSARGHILSLSMALPNGEIKSRRIRIPSRIINSSQISHQMTNGVLRIRVTHQ